MPHHTPLIGTIVAGLVFAFAAGALAHRLRIPPIAGYLLAGVIIGPFTPGFVADAGLANELSELGVILLMFGVGLHFSLKDLLSVRGIAVPGAIAQILVATLLGSLMGWAMGWPLLASVMFGLALSVASTVVLLRALQSRNLVQTERGRIAVGWLIVEDLVMVLTLVLLPAVVAIQNNPDGTGMAELFRSAGAIALKVTGFFVVMLVVGKRLIPSLLHWTAHTGSRELFRLAVLSIALGVAFGAAVVFDVSFALGAFFAGMILGETQLSRRAAEETLPLRDAFAVLFFVSVGMLFDPGVLLKQPLPLLGTVAIILVGKSVAAYGIVRFFGYPRQTALTVSVSLAQIGEFSFILAGLGVGLGVLTDDARDLVLAGAILSILVNPLLFALIVKGGRASSNAEPTSPRQKETAPEPPPPLPPARMVLVGFGRVGQLIARQALERGDTLTVIEDQGDMAELAKKAGFTVIVDDAAAHGVLEKARIDAATTLLIAIPEGLEAGVITVRARQINPSLRIIARAHSDEEVEHLARHGADHVVMGEREIALRMAALAASPGGK
ncbi:YbaL family putative K(+) efflux transporter [Tsuneonella sp. CC-YZS046]|uniref:YbaL family putative K(+) efflux transporter n=1 Tax=Tsuneonella sp. CC-YZS046 TaxID=3042152 RepID=UPI002D79C4FC|nr:YbaL family putative K(+) efflux transporter [Tsuneonella sp. CC-YZS046]WRO65373.1 YbaL family putative K(+) efflux transporter [Tsuneonella sp. CC-YZS046]